jgi:hypothetical protein
VYEFSLNGTTLVKERYLLFFVFRKFEKEMPSITDKYDSLFARASGFWSKKLKIELICSISMLL